MTLQAVCKENVAGGSAKDPNTGLSAVIAANGFTIHVDNVAALDAQNAAKRAGAEAVGSDGETITQIEEAAKNARTAKASRNADSKITVTVVDMHPTVTVKKAVRTGDVAPIWLLVALLAVSAGAVTTVSICRRKK